MVSRRAMRNPGKRWLTETKHLLWLFWQLKRPSERKLHLYACACSRRIWDLLPDDQCRRAVELVERRADGLAGASEVTEVRKRFASLLARLNRQRQYVGAPREDQGD